MTVKYLEGMLNCFQSAGKGCQHSSPLRTHMDRVWPKKMYAAMGMPSADVNAPSRPCLWHRSTSRVAACTAYESSAHSRSPQNAAAGSHDAIASADSGKRHMSSL